VLICAISAISATSEAEQPMSTVRPRWPGLPIRDPTRLCQVLCRRDPTRAARWCTCSEIEPLAMEEEEISTTSAPRWPGLPIRDPRYRERICAILCQRTNFRASRFCNCNGPSTTTEVAPVLSREERQAPSAEGTRYRIQICRQICRRDPSLGGHYCNCDQFPMFVFSDAQSKGQPETAENLLTKRPADNTHFVRAKRI